MKKLMFLKPIETTALVNQRLKSTGILGRDWNEESHKLKFKLSLGNLGPHGHYWSLRSSLQNKTTVLITTETHF